MSILSSVPDPIDDFEPEGPRPDLTEIIIDSFLPDPIDDVEPEGPRPDVEVVPIESE